MTSLGVLLLLGSVPGRAQSALDGFDPNTNAAVRTIAVQPDGKILLGGEFTVLSPNGGLAVTRSHIARVNPDGTLDASFDPNANNTVFAIAVQPDGKILLGGGFTSILGVTRNHVARLNADGSLDLSFDPNASDNVRTIAVTTDGNIFVAGEFTSIGGQTRNRIARLDTVTGLPDSFDSNADNAVYTVGLQADGNLLVGGLFTTIGGQTRNRIARLDATTGLADSFDPNANDSVSTLALQADGKILVGGVFTNIGGQARNRIARLEASGLADSFNPDGDREVFTIAVQADGNILTGGLFTSIGGQSRHSLARLDSRTGLSDSFDPHPNNPVYAMALQADGKIVAGGLFTALEPNATSPVNRNYIARFETDGMVDKSLSLTFSPEGDLVLATALQPDGKILIGGSFTAISNVTRHRIARLNSDGSLDPSFNPNADDSVRSIVVRPDGKIIVGGRFTSIGGQSRNRIARLDGATGMPDSFDPNANDTVYTVAVQPDDMILVSGTFTSIGGQMRNRIARIDSTTGVADSFDPDSDGAVISMAVQGSKIVAAGYFTSIGGETRHRIARLDSLTGLADPLDPDANDAVYTVTLQTNGKILAGGPFTSIGGQIRNHIARLDGATGLADSFDPNSDGAISTLAVQADGKVLAGGFFSLIGGQKRNSIARLDPTTGVADLFDPDSSSDAIAIAHQADGKILAAGSFFNIGGEMRDALARLSNDTAALQDLIVRQDMITWTRAGACPQFSRATFEYSTDTVNYMPLGEGRAIGTDWILTGLDLPTERNLYVRAHGYYRGGYFNNAESITKSVRNVFLSGSVMTPARALNISTRLRVELGDRVMIGGFIITGNGPKNVAVRGIGPSLGSSGINGTLTDPVLELRDSTAELLFQNDNWQDDSAAAGQLIALGLAPQNPNESGIVATLQPSASYTAILSGNSDGIGVGLVEVYDTNQAANSQLANISTRGFVQTGDNVMIGGFILGGGNGNTSVAVRGIGPSLAQSGLNNVLGDPTVELRDSNGALFSSNDNWQDDPASAAQLIAHGLAPQNSLESGIFTSLLPGPFTAILAGRDGTTGIGLVEVYNLQ